MFTCKEDHYDFLLELEILCESLRTAHISGKNELICKLNQKIIRHLRNKDEPSF